LIVLIVFWSLITCSVKYVTYIMRAHARKAINIFEDNFRHIKQVSLHIFVTY